MLEKTKDSDSILQLRVVLAFLLSCKIFPDLLKAYLQKKQISPQELAKRIHIDASAVSHWLKARRFPQDSGIIFQIGSALSLTSEQRKRLLLAWSVHRELLNLVPYVKSCIDALERGQNVDSSVEAVVRILQQQLVSFEQSDTD